MYLFIVASLFEHTSKENKKRHQTKATKIRLWVSLGLQESRWAKKQKVLALAKCFKNYQPAALVLLTEKAIWRQQH